MPATNWFRNIRGGCRIHRGAIARARHPMAVAIHRASVPPPDSLSHRWYKIGGVKRQRDGGTIGRFDAIDIGDPLAEIGIFAGAGTPQEVDERLRSEVVRETDAMLRLMEHFDAFDVVELMRMRELPIAPSLALEPGYDGSGAAIEIVALMLLARGDRHPSQTPRSDTRPNEVINELHTRTKRLLRLSTYRAKVVERLTGAGPLHRLAAEYQTYLVAVRAYQYESVQDEHEQALFGRPEIERVVRDHLGFTYDDLVRVRRAVLGLYSDKMTTLRDTIGEIVQAHPLSDGRPPDEQIEAFQEAIVDWMFLPAERASFTPEDIALHVGLDTDLVARVLDRFSVDFDSSESADARVADFLRGVNPLGRRALLRSGNHHLLASSPPGADTFRTVLEEAIPKQSKDWERYNKSRRIVTEALAVSALERALGTSPLATSLLHFAPDDSHPVDALGHDCTDLSAVGKQVESDALFVIGDVAICLEVKGSSIADAARTGDVTRLRREVQKILGDGAKQTRRLEDLIRVNGGIWQADCTWLDLSHVREVRTIVAGIDHFGPLSVALGDLRASGLIAGGSMPWCVTIHDLDVISRVVDRPTELLLYLRRRTESGVTAHFRGSDELDLFMLFLDGGLFVEDDPDEVHRLHPRTPPPSETARKQYRKSNRPTLVGTHTNPLDAWMYWQEGKGPDEAEKPTFNIDATAAVLVDFMAKGRKPGWFRIGADLLALSGEAQRRLTNAIQEALEMTNTDGKPHTLTQGFASVGGYPTVYVRTHPAGADRDAEADDLATYMIAKKHQVGSDRALGLLIDHNGQIVTTFYMNGLPTEDPELDALGDAIGLKRTWVKPKRASSLSAKKRKRRAKRGRP